MSQPKLDYKALGMAFAIQRHLNGPELPEIVRMSGISEQDLLKIESAELEPTSDQIKILTNVLLFEQTFIQAVGHVPEQPKLSEVLAPAIPNLAELVARQERKEEILTNIFLLGLIMWWESQLLKRMAQQQEYKIPNNLVTELKAHLGLSSSE